MTKSQLRRLTLAFGLMIAALALSSIARADDPAPTPAPVAKRADGEGFVPVAAGDPMQPGEVIPASRLVGIAYGVILAALVLFVASVSMRSQNVEDEIMSLRARINKHVNKDKQA
jgi:hypothetical protein